MLKLKTSKSALKRFKITSKGKLFHRQPGTNHFNAKDNGNSTRNKRTQGRVGRQNMKDLDNLMPYIN